MPLHTTYPTGQDVVDYLDSLGLRTFMPDPLWITIKDKIVAVIAAWEQQSLWTPFLTTYNNPEALDTDRFFDPPLETRFLFFGGGLLSLTSLTTGYTGPGTGFVQTSGIGFRPFPQNAPAQGRSYEGIEFLSGGYDLAQSMGYPFGLWGMAGLGGSGRVGSIQIAGQWGRHSLPPDDVWQVIVEKAVSLCLPAFQLALSSGLLTWTEDGVTQTRNPDPLKVIRDSLSADWGEVLGNHKRIVTYV